MATRSKSRATRQAAEYRRRLKALKKIGAYSPNSDELTRFRKTQINKAWAEFGPLIDNPRNPSFFIPAPQGSAQRRDQFMKEAKALGIKTTPKGILYAKGGHTKAELRYDTRDNEFRVKLTGKVKRGDNKGKRYADIVPIAPLDKVNDERGRIRRMAEEFGPLKKGEQIGFVLQENNRELGASRATFHSAESLMRYIDANYHRDNKAAKLAFLRMVVVRKTTLITWTKNHPLPGKRRAQRKLKVVSWKVIETATDEVKASGLDKTTATRMAKKLTRQYDSEHVAAPEWR
jgi:hypothetical protein